MSVHFFQEDIKNHDKLIKTITYLCLSDFLKLQQVIVADEIYFDELRKLYTKNRVSTLKWHFRNLQIIQTKMCNHLSI